MRFVFILLAMAACHAKSDVPSCEAVGGTFYGIATGDLGKASVDAKTERRVKDQLPAMRDELVTVCKDSKWEPAVRTCMGSASTHDAFLACETQLTPTQRDWLDRGAEPQPASK
ncbi:MAG: hypothetical protein QM831_04535 [Kofleriaceae bacterium]